jgi:nicotinate-nucleotide pyrophosphorylase (carboxylating)
MNIDNILDWEQIDKLIDLALTEDLKGVGDTTSLSVIPKDLDAVAILKVKEPCIVSGLEVAKKVFMKVDPNLNFEAKVSDGDSLETYTVIAEISGNAQSLLTAERTALNFLQRLAGISTITSEYVKALGDSKTKILDTRKTTPGWRSLEKYAVAAGGGTNHRMGLYDRVMIKDNHRELAGIQGEGGITRSVKLSREMFPNLEVEVEADSFEEVIEASKIGADYILLDNMTNEEMKKVVEALKGTTSKLEASGGITIERIPSIAQIGVDFISVGALTHSVKSADISMEIILR